MSTRAGELVPMENIASGMFIYWKDIVIRWISVCGQEVKEGWYVASRKGSGR